jgi:hypothetical protein
MQPSVYRDGWERQQEALAVADSLADRRAAAAAQPGGGLSGDNFHRGY